MRAIPVSSDNLQSAISILDAEEKRLPLTAKRRGVFSALKWVAYSFPFIGTVVGIFWGLWLVSKASSLLEAGWYLVLDFVNTTIPLALLSIVMIGLMLIVNLPLLWSIARQDWALRRLDLSAGIADRDASQARGSQLSLWVGPFVAGWGILFFALACALSMPGPTTARDGWFPFVDMAMIDSRGQALTVVGLCTFWTIVVGGFYLVLHYLQSAKSRLGQVANLRKQLRQAGNDMIDPSLLDGLVRIERGQIARARIESIRRFDDDQTPALIVQKSLQASKKLQKLASREMMAAIEAIDDLSQGGAADGEGWRAVADTDVELNYRCDVAAGRIQILDIRDAGHNTERLRA